MVMIPTLIITMFTHKWSRAFGSVAGLAAMGYANLTMSQEFGTGDSPTPVRNL